MCKRANILIFLLCVSVSVFAQFDVIIEVRSLPQYHDTASSLYLAGSFNSWNPRDEKFRFQKTSHNLYSIGIKLSKGSYEYKITRGGWEKVEIRKNGSSINNRSLVVESDLVQHVDIEEWQDRIPPKPKKSTSSTNVRLIAADYKMPQLGRSRRIWIYLPENYFKSKEKYPVLYAHDGQNLFNDSTAFSGEWGIDEFMDSVKLRKCIVVGIDHGGDKRLNEYNPYDNPRFGKGEGDLYVDFLVKTLKPFIDKNYRTRKGRESTWVAGSSMGGLISMYAILKYPKKFGGAGVFSPAFWVAPGIFNDISRKGHKVKGAIYYYAGKHESEEMVPDMLKAFGEMKKVSKSRMTVVIRDDGKHNESTWRNEFPLFYSWLIK